MKYSRRDKQIHEKINLVCDVIIMHSSGPVSWKMRSTPTHSMEMACIMAIQEDFRIIELNGTMLILIIIYWLHNSEIRYGWLLKDGSTCADTRITITKPECLKIAWWKANFACSTFCCSNSTHTLRSVFIFHETIIPSLIFMQKKRYKKNCKACQ